MLEYYFVGSGVILGCFWWMEVILGSTIGSMRSVLNYVWILNPVYNVIIFWGLEKEGPTLVSLCVFYYFSSLALTINLYIFLHHISFEAVLISPCSLWDNPVYEASQYASGKYCPLRVPGSPSTGPRARGIAPSTRAPELANMCYYWRPSLLRGQATPSSLPWLGWALGWWSGCLTTAPLLCAVCRCRCRCCCCSVFARVYICLLARVGVLGHHIGAALGHLCRMPPTGANNAVLLLKTRLAPDSTYT